MGLNTQFPDWMQQATDSNRRAGAQLGQNIVQGLRFREDVKQQALENRNLTAVQDAQLLINQSQATIQRLAAQKAALEADRLVQSESAAADLLALDSDFSSSPNGYNDENRSRLYQFLREKPAARFSNLYPQIEKKFDLAKEFERDLTLKETELAGRMVMAERAPRNSVSYNDEVSVVEDMVRRGEITSEQAPVELQKRLDDKKRTTLQKNTDFSLQLAVDAGLDGDVSELRSVIASNSGRVPRLNEGTVVKLADRAAVIELTDSVLDKIESFEPEFGKDWLDSYIGQFDGPFDEVLDTIRKRTGAKDLAARDILQTFEDARTGKMKSISGGTITSGEQTRLDRVIGTSLNKNFVNALKTFNRNDRSNFSTVMDGFKNTIVPENLKRIAQGRQKPSTTPATDKAVDTGRSVRLPATNRFRKGTTVIQNGVKYTFE